MSAAADSVSGKLQLPKGWAPTGKAGVFVYRQPRAKVEVLAKGLQKALERAGWKVDSVPLSSARPSRVFLLSRGDRVLMLELGAKGETASLRVISAPRGLRFQKVRLTRTRRRPRLR